MTFTIALAQTRHPEDGDVVSLVKKYAMRSKELGADILVFPESLMTRFEDERQAFIDDAQPLNGPFAHAIDQLAAHYKLWVLYNINERNLSGGNPYNTLVLTDSNGNQQSVYRKIHLFDSSTTSESKRISAGDHVPDPPATPFGNLGFATCYDLRFPELARKLALKGCDLLFYPAAWVDGPSKQMQWETLLRARAIENEMYVAGVCRCDNGYVGTSYVFAPDGQVVAQARPLQEDLVIAPIDYKIIETVRSRIPVFTHRRPDLYQ
jgi:predicted amidohydrolase